MRSWGALKDPKVPGKLKDLSEAGFVQLKQWDDQGNRVFRLHAVKPEVCQSMAVGDKYIHLARTNIAQNFHADDCADLTAMNITVYASPASAFAANSTTRFAVINCKAIMKPGRWHSNNADAVHCQRNQVGPWVEDCYFEGIIDDPVNIYSVRSRLKQRVDDHTLLFKAMRPRTFIKEYAIGQPLILFNQREGRVIATLKITDMAEQGETIRVTVDGKLPKLYISGKEDGDVAFVGHNLSHDFVLKNNTFRVGQRHCIIMGGHGLIEGNTFDQISGPGLSILNHNRGGNNAESLVTGDLIIRDNTFINCDFGPFAYSPKQAYGCLYLGSKTWDQKPGKEQLIGRVLIENNTFTNIRKAGINLNSAHDVLIRGNRFSSSMDTPLDHDTSHAAIMMDNVSRVKITGNTLTDSRPQKLTFISKSDNVQQVQVTGNTITP
jgi:parallel beta-helix repeat protein